MVRPKDKGVTLIELMIVLVIAAILVAGIYSLFITQQRSYTVQDQVAGVQQDARAALNIMARDIRMAGMAVGAGSGSGFTDGSNPFLINGSFRYAVNPVNRTSAPDSITVVLGAVELGRVQNVTGTTVTLDRNVGNGALLVAFDLKPRRLYNANGDGSPNIIVTNFPSGNETVGGKAYGVQSITYSVANDVLSREGQPLAGDGTATLVEDLQFAYQVAGDADWYNDPATDFPAGTTEADIRMVRINIIVRTAVADPQDTTFFKPESEDRGREDNFTGCRRRVYTTVVKVRNI